MSIVMSQRADFRNFVCFSTAFLEQAKEVTDGLLFSGEFIDKVETHWKTLPK